MNLEQQSAAEYTDGPLLVLAGPGTGKTTTLVGRYKFLLGQKTNPKKIICCTFSKKAADELKLRIAASTSVPVEGLPISTFHALALRIVRSIGDEIDVPPDFEIWAKDLERIKIIKKLQKPVQQAKFYKDVNEEDKSAKAALAYRLCKRRTFRPRRRINQGCRAK